MAFNTTAQMYTVENAFFIKWPDEECSGGNECKGKDGNTSVSSERKVNQ